MRQKVSALVFHKYFENSAIFIIIVSSVLLALENPIEDPNSHLSNALNQTDNMFSCIFVVECLMKILAQGLIFNGPESYL